MIRRRDLALLPMNALLGRRLPAGASPKRIAGIVTEYRFWSHADVILGRILGGYSPNNVHQLPRTRLVSLYTDQKPQNDMSRDLAARHGFRIYPRIADALTLGTGRLAVDGVIFVGEHGDYPTNALGQKLYPRFELFSQILDVFDSAGRCVPAFFDKHLSYSWEKAKALYDRARRLGLTWFAGSSIPVTVRTPPLEYALETPLEEAVAVGYGPHDAYGFHLLETLQCMVERRKGGETGIASVEWIEGDAVWRWLGGEGSWSQDLFEAAIRSNPLRPQTPLEQEARAPVIFVLNYRDGFRAAALILAPSGSGWMFAARRRPARSVDATYFGLAEPGGRPLPHFDGLVKCIEDLMVTAKPPYPVERTLLTTGALAFLFESKRVQRRIETPELGVAYKAPPKAYFQRS